MLESKLFTGTSRTKRLHQDKFEFSLFWMSQWVACSPAWRILYHVTASCKGPIGVIFGQPILFQRHYVHNTQHTLFYHLTFRFSPIGICSLIAANIAAVDNILDSFRMLGMYTLTVICGLGIHLLVVLPLIYFAVIRANPFKFMMRMNGAIVTMIGTASRWLPWLMLVEL